MVIRDGEIVAEEMVSELLPAYSSTKSWSSMVVGLLVDQGLVSLTDTLGDIFDTTDWQSIRDGEAKQTLTLQEVLTFTGGLTEIGDLQDGFDNQNSLEEVLNATSYSAEQRGNFEYLPTNHLLANIVAQVSGKTPLEVASDAFAAMGMVEGTDYTWDTYGGVQGSAFGLNYNPRTLAKLGLLYLQQGLAASDVRVLSTEWVNASTTNQLGEGNTPNNRVPSNGYGYQWYTQDDGSYQGVGAGGQIVAVYPDKNIVLSIMTSFDGPLSLVFATTSAFKLQGKLEDAFDAIDSDCNCRGGLLGSIGCK